MVYVISNELTHYGILGQKWGIRRYQNPDGSLTEAGKKRYGTVENLEAGRTVKQAKRHEAEKKKAIASGNSEQVQKFSKELTQEEMQRAFQRISDEQKLTNLRNTDIVLGKEKLQHLIDVGGKVKEAAQTVTDVYNVGAKIYNALNKDGKQLPIIGEKKPEPKSEDEYRKFMLERDKQKFEWEKADRAKREAEAANGSKSNDKSEDKSQATSKSSNDYKYESKTYKDGEYHYKYADPSPSKSPASLPEHDYSYSQKYKDPSVKVISGYLPSGSMDTKIGLLPSPTSTPPSGGSSSVPSSLKGKTIIDVDYKSSSSSAPSQILALPAHVPNANATNRVVNAAANMSVKDLQGANNALLNEMYKNLTS